ncbi:MAG TPA: MFS transporter [Gemmataceae bacterium]|nr:MFS transporter [Gemmataceae bacterium]
MTPWNQLAPLAITTAFGFGLILALLGSIKLTLAQRCNLDEAKVGGLLAVFNLALIPLLLASGWLVDHLGILLVVGFGSVVTALALAALALARTYTGSRYALLVLGAGAACLCTGATVLMPRAFFEGHTAAALNFGNIFFGLGALAAPALADTLIRVAGFRRGLSLLALLCLAPAVATLQVPSTALPAVDQPGALSDVLTQPAIWLTALVVLLYLPIEGALGTWATTYLADTGHSPRRAAFWLSGFWLVFLLGRLAMAWLLQRGYLPRDTDAWIVVVLGLACAVALGNLSSMHRRAGATQALLLVGLLLGPVFPTLIGVLFQHVSAADRGTAFGAVYALGSAGSLLLPPLIGAQARRTSVRIAMRIPSGVAVLMGGAAAALALMQG